MKQKTFYLLIVMLIAGNRVGVAEDIDIYLESMKGTPGCENTVMSSGAFIAPVVSLDPETPVEDGDEVYLVFFQSGEEFGWHGNLKKYQLKLMTRGDGDCDRTMPEWVIADANGNPAVDCEGKFNPTSVSFWSDETDGGAVTRGGVGKLLKDTMDLVNMAAGPYYDFRHIYTCKDPSVSLSLERFYRDRDNAVPDTISPQDLGISTGNIKSDFLERDRLINLLYGYTSDITDSGGTAYNPVKDGNPVNQRTWILGDIIHSRPVIIDYLDEKQHLEYRFLAVGANDGMLHVFAESVNPAQPDAAVTINGRVYRPGDEIWAFIPGECLPLLAERADIQKHPYFVDGSIRLYTADTWKRSDAGNMDRQKGEYLDKTLVFGMRRGGRSYWALDVSQPDPCQWSVKWRIKGGESAHDFSPDLGYTWSDPVFATIKTGAGHITDVVVFGGGYDPEEDFYPEPWEDGNKDGTYDPNNPADKFDIHNDLHDVNDNDIYDAFNPDQNETGRGIFVVNLEDGRSIFKATFGHHDGPDTHPAHEDMKWCFPSEPTVINTAGGLIIYINDVYGQVWKVTYDYHREKDKWGIKRIFQANPGSDQPDAFTALSVSPSLDDHDTGRKSFYSPDVSFSGTDWTDAPVLYFGTGDRVHPGYIPNYHNRFYSISDTNESADETHLINLTCDELDRYADADQNGLLEHSGNDDNDTQIQKALTAILYGETPYPEKKNICRGWYRILGRQGECAQDILADHSGEMCLSQPVLFNRIIYFTTYQPTRNDLCVSPGNSYIYSLDYSTGTSALGFTGINVPEPFSNGGTLACTYKRLEHSGIVSEIRVILKSGMASAFVQGGNGLFPVGEEGPGKGAASSIPAITGGVGQLLWEVY